MAIDITVLGVVAPLTPSPIPSVVLTEKNDFMKQMDIDLESTFFNREEFAEKDKNKYTHVNGQVEYYSIIFDDPTTDLGLGSNVDVTLVKPQAQIIEKQLVNQVAKDDEVIIRGITYRVESYVSDGVGVTTLFLSRR